MYVCVYVSLYAYSPCTCACVWPSRPRLAINIIKTRLPYGEDVAVSPALTRVATRSKTGSYKLGILIYSTFMGCPDMCRCKWIMYDCSILWVRGVAMAAPHNMGLMEWAGGGGGVWGGTEGVHQRGRGLFRA